MIFEKDKFNRLLKSISFRILNTNESLVIKSKFNLFNKSIFGLILIASGGIYLMYVLIKIINIEDSITILDITLFSLFGILGVTLTLGGILGIYSSCTDYVKIDKHTIKFKNKNFRSTKIKLNSNFRIYKRSFRQHINSTQTIGTTFRFVELYLIENDKKHRILDFQMNENQSSEAIKLGEELRLIILHRIKNYLQQDI